MNRLALGVVLGLLATATAFARPPGKWWQDEKIKAELKLTAEQSARIEEIFQAMFPKSREDYEELKKREEQLSNAISARGTTEADVIRQADQIEVIRGRLNKARIVMLFRMRQVLSPEQRLRLQAIQRERDREGRPPSERQ